MKNKLAGGLAIVIVGGCYVGVGAVMLAATGLIIWEGLWTRHRSPKRQDGQ